jgi:hypothetical protein
MERINEIYTSNNGEGIIDNSSSRLHPSHYGWFRERFGTDLMDIVAEFNFNRGNAIKYLVRAGHKGEYGIDCVDKEIEDLNKAIVYLIHEVKRLEIRKIKDNSRTETNASV